MITKTKIIKTNLPDEEIIKNIREVTSNFYDKSLELEDEVDGETYELENMGGYTTTRKTFYGRTQYANILLERNNNKIVLTLNSNDSITIIGTVIYIILFLLGFGSGFTWGILGMMLYWGYASNKNVSSNLLDDIENAIEFKSD